MKLLIVAQPVDDIQDGGLAISVGSCQNQEVTRFRNVNLIIVNPEEPVNFNLFKH